MCEKKVLIIDDEKWFFEPILDRLTYEKIGFDFCISGSQGLEYLKANKYRVVILDIKVTLGRNLQHLLGKDASGISILEEIRKIEHRIPVICFTVLNDEEIRDKILKLGGKHILKATDDDELINTIKKHF